MTSTGNSPLGGASSWALNLPVSPYLIGAEPGRNRQKNALHLSKALINFGIIVTLRRSERTG